MEGRTLAMITLDRVVGRSPRGTERSGASIREVCLLGGGFPASDLDSGDSIAWAGRSYIVSLTDRGDTLHLRPADHDSR
jgi:hypothetical protein